MKAKDKAKSLYTFELQALGQHVTPRRRRHRIEVQSSTFFKAREKATRIADAWMDQTRERWGIRCAYQLVDLNDQSLGLLEIYGKNASGFVEANS